MTASNVAAMIHLLSCCVQLNSPETQSEQKPGREGRSSSEPAQVYPPSNHNGNSDMTGAARLGKSAHPKNPKSEQATSNNKGTEAMRHVQRTGVDKILAIRFWGGVGGANIKNMYTPLAPQTRRTTEY